MNILTEQERKEIVANSPYMLFIYTHIADL